MNNELIQFENYLIEIEETDSSIAEHLRNLGYFDSWCQMMQIEGKEYLELRAIKEYVKFMDAIPVKIGTQNIRLNSLSKYYDFLKLEGVITRNPMRSFRIRPEKKTVVHNNLNEDELEDLYKAYVEYSDSKSRRPNIPWMDENCSRMKLIVSLVIFQGLHTGELDKLTVQDINLENSTIYIPATGRSNSRVLALHQSQILAFYKYLSTLPKDQEKLFANKIQKGFDYILKELKGLNPTIQNLQHIRGSVLLSWIKKYGKRKAQYMIGHRFVSSTERYEVQDVSELSELMETTHLFG